jgi:hypothetical protein
MSKNLLPPGVETFLSSETGAKLTSSLRDVYEALMLDTAKAASLTKRGADLGVTRPPILAGDDDFWRAAVKKLAYTRKHTRPAVGKFFELILGPQVSQVSVLDRTVYSQIAIGNSLELSVGSTANLLASPYTVNEVLTHHLIFPAGTFPTVPDLNVTYSIEGTTSPYGNIVALSDGRQALVDTTVTFVNTHPFDFLTQLNTSVPQYGKVIFDKNSTTTQEKRSYEFYDNMRSGILKLDNVGSVPDKTKNKYVRARSSVLSAPASTGSLSLTIQNSSDFPVSPAMVQAIQVGDRITILNDPPLAPINITDVSKNAITVGGGLPVPGAPADTDITYIITSAASTIELSGGRGHFLSKKGKILSGTMLVDYTEDFTKPIKPYITGTKEPFSVTLNRGGNNEETLEVLSRSGVTLNLVLDPKNKLNETSLLKYNHDKGETIEVVTKNTYSTGSYFALNAAGVTVGTATGGGATTLIDATLSPFVTQNADVIVVGASYGDELEIVTSVVGGPPVGETRTIISVVATTATVSPKFTAAVITGCTYRVRKLYKPRVTADVAISNEDQYLYLADTSMFPTSNFSAILDRGTEQEEVVWVDENDLDRKRLRIANGDWWDGTGSANAYLTKKHYFGVKVEPAQVLFESCPWEIIETKATGEYTIAIDDGCVPDNTPKDSWYLHEKTPAHLVNASNFGASQIGEVRGNDVVASLPTSVTNIPRAVPGANITAADTSFKLTHNNYIRLLANLYDPFEGNAGENIFRPLFVGDGNHKEEVFATSLNSESFKSYGQLVSNALAGDTTIVVTNISASTDIQIGQWGAKYRRSPEARTVSSATEVIKIVPGVTQLVVTAPAGALVAGSPYTIASVEKNILRFLPGTFDPASLPAAGTVAYSVGAFSGTGKTITFSLDDGTEVLQDTSVNFLQPNWEPNQWKLTLTAGLTYPHFKGESVNLDPVTINISGLFKNSYAMATPSYVHYLYTHPTYRHKSDAILDPAFPVGLKATPSVNYPASAGLIRRGEARQFSRHNVADEIYIKKTGGAAPSGERRSIAAVGGVGNEVLFVGEHTQFSSTVDSGDEFDVRSFLQSGDISNTTKYDILNNENAAFPAGLNSINKESYLGGHKSIFPGSYIYRQLNVDYAPANQPSHQFTTLWAAPDPTDNTAIYKFPGPRRLIAPPKVPYAEETVVSAPDELISKEADTLVTGNLKDKYVEILAPTTSRDYRRVIKIIGHFSTKITLKSALVDKPVGSLLPYKFRVLASATEANALDPITPTSGSPYFWVDYPELFPDPSQSNFTVTLARGSEKAEDIGVVACINYLGPNYGRFTIETVEAVTGTFLAGDSIELKTEKISLNFPVGLATTNNGGFYLGFGFEPDNSKMQEIGLGGDPTLLGEGKGNTVDKFSAGAHPPAVYNALPDATINNSMYYVANGSIEFPTPTLSNTRVRCNVISSTIFGGTTTITISDFNFLKQKYRWFIGGTVSGYLNASVGTITEIDPATSEITIDVALVIGAGDPIVLLAKKVPTDDKERQSNTNNYFTFSKFSTSNGTEIDGIFPTVKVSAVNTDTVLTFANSALSTSLIGHRLICLSTGTAIPVGTQVSIVDATATTLTVSPPFVAAPVSADVFAIIPSEDFKYSNISDRAGGVYTGLNDPEPVNPAGTKYPALINGVSREYGVVQEYVEYSSRDGNILTLSEPFYPKYDHLPKSTVVVGTNHFSTEGYGNDYRPFLAGSYLEILFNSDVVKLKSLFCAAGIDGKTEITELGS